jgi:uncharacterized protein YybS (DUF2232 family)
MKDMRTIAAASLWAAGLCLSGLLIPFLGQIAALFTPVPLIILWVRSGRRAGLAALAFAGVAVLSLAGPQATVILVSAFGLMAVGVGEGMFRKFKAEGAVLLGGLLPLAVLGAALTYYFVRIGKNPVAVLEQSFHEILKEAVALYLRVGLKESAEMVAAASDKFVYYMVRLMPALAVTSSVLQAACCYGLARVLMLKRDGQASGYGGTSLAAWYAPDVWVWGLILALSLVAIPSSSGRTVGLNLVIVFIAVYAAQGMAVVEHALKKVRIASFGRGLIHALILATPLLVFVTALGVVDIWADFRKVREGAIPPE